MRCSWDRADFSRAWCTLEAAATWNAERHADPGRAAIADITRPERPPRGTDLRNLGTIQDGAVLVAGGLIVEVGPSRRLENLALARGAAEIDASGCVVLPGFVDSHVHPGE